MTSATKSPAAILSDLFRAVVTDAAASLVGRADAAKLLVLAVLARTNIFFIGPPGVAKSALVEGVTTRITGARRYSTLMTRTSMPEDVFGPVDLAAFEQGTFKRVPAGMLQEAHIAFLDEVFKANSAVLNSLLTVMNERRFAERGQWTPVPCFTVVGASNELPQGNDLGALYDRFLVRVSVKPLTSEAEMAALLAGPRTPPAPAATVTLQQVEQAQREVEKVVVPPAIVQAYIGLRAKLAGVGVLTGDRRFKHALSLVQASAWLDGRAQARVSDLAVVRHVFWSQPAEERKTATAVYDVAIPGLSKALDLLDAAHEARDKGMAAKPGSPSYLEATQALAGLGEAVGKLVDESGADAAPTDILDAETKILDLRDELTRALVGRRR